MDNTIHLVGISGSLRSKSFNTAMLNAVKGLLPEGVTMEIASIADVPLYNGDNDMPIADKRPDAVNKFRDILAKADGFVIVSPEYNYSIPGVLKNAIDWASRGTDSPLLRKPIALMGVTPGMWGTSRMHLAFQTIFLALDMKPVQKPEILVAQAGQKFDDNLKLTDETTISLVKKKLEGLKELILEQRILKENA